MRLFFALSLDHANRYTIAAFQQQRFSGNGRSIPAQNLHVTLLFIGEVEQSRIIKLASETDKLVCDSFDLTMDHLEFFPANGMVWLTASSIPSGLHRLYQLLRGVAVRNSIKTDRKPFRPHITLIRNVTSPPAAETQVPPISLRCEDFTLFQSVQGPQGFRYIALEEWSLIRNMQ